MQNRLIYEASQVLLMRVEGRKGVYAVILGVVRSYLFMKVQGRMC